MKSVIALAGLALAATLPARANSNATSDPCARPVLDAAHAKLIDSLREQDVSFDDVDAIDGDSGEELIVLKRGSSYRVKYGYYHHDTQYSTESYIVRTRSAGDVCQVEEIRREK